MERICAAHARATPKLFRAGTENAKALAPRRRVRRDAARTVLCCCARAGQGAAWRHDRSADDGMAGGFRRSAKRLMARRDFLHRSPPGRRRFAWRRVPGAVRHVFTHFPLELTVYRADVAARTPPPEGTRWVALSQLGGEALPSLMRKVVAYALDRGRHTYSRARGREHGRIDHENRTSRQRAAHEQGRRPRRYRLSRRHRRRGAQGQEHGRADQKHPVPDRRLSRQGRDRQEQASVGQYLDRRHGEFRRDERGVGCLGVARQPAGARHRRGPSRLARLQGRDHGGRRRDDGRAGNPFDLPRLPRRARGGIRSLVPGRAPD